MECLKLKKHAGLKAVLVVAVFFLSLSPQDAKAASEKEFLMACTYGTLAGTLVGAASLAFTDRPGDNLRNVARGASIGLYLGIALGLYVVYVVPSQMEEQQFQLQQQQNGLDEPPLPPDEAIPDETLLQRLQVYPMISQKGAVDGMGAQFKLMTF